MAFTKKEKQDLVAQYEKWLKESQAVFVIAFNKMSMKEISSLRVEARQVDGELHVVKNTLMAIALKNCNLEDKGFFDGSSLVGVANEDVPALAGLLNKVSKTGEIYTIKGGYLTGKALEARQVIALANLPPLPIMRGRLLGMLSAPASKLVRTLVEPARQMAAVLKAKSEKSPTPAAG